MEESKTGLESSFDINRVSFKNVSREFEKKFRENYSRALQRLSDGNESLEKSAGASSLGILEQMARRISDYDEDDDFEKSYANMIRDFEPFTES